MAWLLAGLVLTAVGDIHGPPLLLGFALAALAGVHAEDAAAEIARSTG